MAMFCDSVGEGIPDVTFPRKMQVMLGIERVNEKNGLPM